MVMVVMVEVVGDDDKYSDAAVTVSFHIVTKMYYHINQNSKHYLSFYNYSFTFENPLQPVHKLI